VPVDDLAGFAYRRGEDERLYLDSMVLLLLLLVVVVVVLVLVVFVVVVFLGMVERRSWTLAVWAEGAVDSELRRGGSGGAMPLV
jgi:hypothetical protein